MTLCVFALIASEFMPVSLLTPMAADLLVSEGLAGYGIAMSGAVVAMAPNYFVYMVGRALIGVVIGGFWSMSAATAM